MPTWSSSDDKEFCDAVRLGIAEGWIEESKGWYRCKKCDKWIVGSDHIISKEHIRKRSYKTWSLTATSNDDERRVSRWRSARGAEGKGCKGQEVANDEGMANNDERVAQMEMQIEQLTNTN